MGQVRPQNVREEFAKIRQERGIDLGLTQAQKTRLTARITSMENQLVSQAFGEPEKKKDVLDGSMPEPYPQRVVDLASAIARRGRIERLHGQDKHLGPLSVDNPRVNREYFADKISATREDVIKAARAMERNFFTSGPSPELTMDTLAAAMMGDADASNL